MGRVNPFALALLFPGTGGSALSPLVLGGRTELALSTSAGLNPRLSGGIAVQRGARVLGWDAGVRGGLRYVRADGGAWLHGAIGETAFGARLGAVGAYDVWGNPWFGGTVGAQIARPMGDRAVLSASGGAELVSGIYIEGSLGITPVPYGGVRLDHDLGAHWTLGVGAGWPYLLGLSLETRR
jgi:hypothetical protein